MNDRIAELRKILGITMEKFGQKIGVSTSAVNGIEKGSRAVQERHIRLILAAFPDVSETWLRTGEGDMFRSEKNELSYKYGFSDVCQKAMDVFADLDHEQQLAILEYVNRLIEDLHKNGNDMSPEERAAAEAEEYRKARLAQLKMEESHQSDSQNSAG